MEEEACIKELISQELEELDLRQLRIIYQFVKGLAE